MRTPLIAYMTEKLMKEPEFKSMCKDTAQKFQRIITTKEEGTDTFQKSDFTFVDFFLLLILDYHLYTNRDLDI